MIYRRFGRTELQMPVFSCGGMRYQQSWTRGTKVTPASQTNLQATIDRALQLGIDHIETARGYGTSEAQLGPALARHDRASFKLQTKVRPVDDTQQFEKFLEESFAGLRTPYLDLFAFHGVNTPQYLDNIFKRGGCLEVVDRYRKEGRIRHVGFSTHGPTRLILQAVETGAFDYLNFHYYYIFPDNHPVLEAARRQDMGVFIISPTDKGGRLQSAPARLRAAERPAAPHGVQRPVVPGPPGDPHAVGRRRPARPLRRPPAGAGPAGRSRPAPGPDRRPPGAGLRSRRWVRSSPAAGARD